MFPRDESLRDTSEGGGRRGRREMGEHGERSEEGASSTLTSNFQHCRFVQEAKQSEPEVVFIGDSIVQQMQFSTIWAEKINSLHCVNFGIGGDRRVEPRDGKIWGNFVFFRVENVLWRILNGELDFNVKIEAVVLFVGTNNTDCTPHEIFEGIVELVRVIKEKLGKVHIVVPVSAARADVSLR